MWSKSHGPSKFWDPTIFVELVKPVIFYLLHRLTVASTRQQMFCEDHCWVCCASLVMPLLFVNTDVILSLMITCMHCAVHWVMFEAVQICWVQWWMCSYVYAARWRPCWSKVIENCVSRQEKIVHDWILSNEWTPVCHLGQCEWFSVIWCILTSHNELLLHDAVVTNLHVHVSISLCQWHLATLGCFFGRPM